MSARATALCSTHEREHRTRVRAMARQRIASSDCPLCVATGDVEAAVESSRRAWAEANLAETRLATATARADAAEANADRMNGVVVAIRRAAREGIASGQYWATLQAIAEGCSL